jgi:hypothetical protein
MTDVKGHTIVCPFFFAFANVETIVILPAKSKDTSRAIQVSQLHEASEEYKNLLGFSGEGSHPSACMRAR